MKMVGSGAGGVISETHFVRGEGQGAIHGVNRRGAWPLRGAPTRTREACVLLDISLKIPELSMRVCISFSIKLVHLHCVL